MPDTPPAAASLPETASQPEKASLPKKASLPEKAKSLLDDANFVVVASSNTDGSPQTSILWAGYDGDDLLLSTIQGRKKETNWLRDPRTSVLILDKTNPYTYVEVRGTVSMTADGGTQLIDALSQTYTGKSYTGDDGTDNVRVVVRVSPTKVIER
jgi:PPOX class probable F420-dependent enzyme